MEIIGRSRNIKMSSRKLRLVADEVRDLSLSDMEIALENLNKRAAKPLLWVLGQAIANAENNFGLKRDNLHLKTLEIGEGPRMKRYRFVGRGRVHSILKRTSHIRLVLESEAKDSVEQTKADKSKETLRKDTKKEEKKVKRQVKNKE